MAMLYCKRFAIGKSSVVGSQLSVRKNDKQSWVFRLSVR
jgi:hypothetical protein